jgi:hypothetical protein
MIGLTVCVSLERLHRNNMRIGGTPLSDGILVKNDPEVEDLIVSIILGIEKYNDYAGIVDINPVETKAIIISKLKDLDDFVWSEI